MSTMEQFRLLVTALSCSSAVTVLTWFWSRTVGGYRREPWMSLLAAMYAYDFLAGAGMAGLAYRGVPNNGLRVFLEPGLLIFSMLLFRSWASGPRARQAYLGILGLGLALATVTAIGMGLSRWNLPYILGRDVLILMASLFELRRLLNSESAEPLWEIPRFWPLAAWTVFHATSSIFPATAEFFMRTLHPPLLFIPWVVYGLITLTSNLLAARAFLCPSLRSS